MRPTRTIVDEAGVSWRLAGCGSFGVVTLKGARPTEEFVLAASPGRSTSFRAPLGWFEMDESIFAAMVAAPAHRLRSM